MRTACGSAQYGTEQDILDVNPPAPAAPARIRQRWTTQPSPLLNSQNHDTNKTVFEATKFRRTVLHNNRLTEEMPFLKTCLELSQAGRRTVARKAPEG